MPQFFRRAAPALLATGLGLLCLTQTASVAAQNGVSDADLALFRKAVASLSHARTLQSSSEMRVNAQGAGASVTYRERIRITARKPNQFRSDVTLIRPDGQPGARYLVVCDGSHVWTYRPGLGQYSVSSREAFENRDNDFPALGLYAGALFLSNAGVVAAFTGDSSRDAEQTRAGLSAMGMTLNSRAQTVGNVEYRVYTLNMGRDSFTYKFYVLPQTASIAQVEMKTRQQSLEMQVGERVTGSAPGIAPSASLFRFSPPAGARRVDQINIQPF